MDLTRGICILCTNSTKIIVPPQAEDITALLKDIFAGQIDYRKFDEVNSLLKLCPLCLHNLLAVTDLKKDIKKKLSEDGHSCALCYSEKHLVCVTDWAYFDRLLENVTTEKRHSRCYTCLNCIKCLDVMEKIKINLFKKYPDLKLSDSTNDGKLKKSQIKKKKHHETRDETHKKVQVSSDEEPEYSSQKGTGNADKLKHALKHLKPLKNTKFNIDIDRFKHDKKLLKQIAFVKLSVSNLLPKEYKRLEGKSEKSKRTSVSDSDSTLDSPSSRQSFFKIKLKINSSKNKSQRVSRGKVTKPKAPKTKFLSGTKKELIVKIIKMNLEEASHLDQEYEETKEIRTEEASQLDQEYEGTREIRTPTKASRKLMPEDPLSSSKKRKSVTFAEVLDTEITDGTSRKDNFEATPLKPSLKRNTSSRSGPLKITNGTSSDESDNENSKAGRQEEIDSDLEEVPKSKGYVEEILKNRDDIFDSLKSSGDAEVVPPKIRNNTSSPSSDGNNTDLDDKDKSESDSNIKKINNSDREENKEKSLKATKRKISRIVNVSSSDSENEDGAESISQTSKENEKQEANEEQSIDNKSKSDTQSREDDIEVKNTLNSSSESKDEDQVINDTEQSKSNYKDNKKKSQKAGTKSTNAKHRKRKRSSSDDSGLEESATKKDNSKILLENGDQENKILSTKNGETTRSDEDYNGSDDQEVEKSNLGDTTLEEINKKNDDQDSASNTAILGTLEKTNDKNIDDQVSDKSSREDNMDNDKSNIEVENNSSQADDKHSSDVESNSEKSSKSISSYDSTNSRSKSKIRNKSIVDMQEDDADILNISIDEDIEEPETKREKVSEVDHMNTIDSETDVNTSETKNEDMPLGILEKKKDVGAVDNKIDEIIAKFSNPSIPNLNNDNNVSDRRNVGAGGENQGSRSEVSSRGSEDAVVSTTIKDVISEENREHFDENDGKDGYSDITTSSDAPNKNYATDKDLDFDDILENIVDSC